MKFCLRQSDSNTSPVLLLPFNLAESWPTLKHHIQGFLTLTSLNANLAAAGHMCDTWSFCTTVLYTQNYKLPPPYPMQKVYPLFLLVLDTCVAHGHSTWLFCMPIITQIDPPTAISIPRVIDSCDLRLVLWERVTYSAASTSNTKEENINYIHHFGVAERAVTANTVRSNSAPDKVSQIPTQAVM